MAQDVTLLCGVPGSGKTWVATALRDKFCYVEHDYCDDPVGQAWIAANTQAKPVLLDCPFAERKIRDALIDKGLNVTPVFIVEDPATIAHRYASREGKPASKSTLTRSVTIKERAEEWGAKFGTSTEILDYLRGL